MPTYVVGYPGLAQVHAHFTELMASFNSRMVWVCYVPAGPLNPRLPRCPAPGWPRQPVSRLNYSVYPYAEADGWSLDVGVFGRDGAVTRPPDKRDDSLRIFAGKRFTHLSLRLLAGRPGVRPHPQR